MQSRTGQCFGRWELFGVPGALWVSLVTGGVLLFTGGCRQESPPAVEVVRPVRTTVLKAGERARVAALPGIAKAMTTVELAFQVPGLLVRLPVEEGQEVAKGDVIGELRVEEFKSRQTALSGQLEQLRVQLRTLKAGVRPEERLRLESDLRAAEARLVSAKAQYERFSGLLASNAVARADFDRVEAEYRVAREDRQTALQLLEMGTSARSEYIEATEAEIRGLEGRVREATLQVEDTTLRAPFAGVVARRFVDANQSITVRQPIVQLQTAGELSVDVDVPERLMAKDLRTADLSATTAEFVAIPGRQFPVRIGEIAQVADPVTQTFRVRFVLTKPPGVNLLPGMSSIVRLRYGQAGGAGGALLVPLASVYTEGSGTKVVWVIGGDLVARRTVVKVGEIVGESIEVLDGLREGDRIATAGVSQLRDGQKVRDLGDALGGTGQ